MCTETQTYAVRQVTQSNSILLCTLGGGSSKVWTEEKGVGGGLNDSNAQVVVRDNVSQLLELIPVVARTGRIESFLSESLYEGEEEEENKNEEERQQQQQQDLASTMQRRRKYTVQQAASVIQASPAELRTAFRHCYVVEMDGYVRMMEPNYLTQALFVLLAHVDKLALDAQRVMLKPALAALRMTHDMRHEAGEALLTEWFGKRRSDGQADLAESSSEVELDTRAITRHIGLHLLREYANGRPTELESFVDRWKQACGALLSDDVNLDMLKGNFITLPAPPAVPTKLQPAQILHFSASQLPLDISARFQALFTIRERWTVDDLSPFLSDVAIDNKRRDALLLKFARSSLCHLPVTETKAERRARLHKGVPHPPSKPVQLYSSRLRYGTATS